MPYTGGIPIGDLVRCRHARRVHDSYDQDGWLAAAERTPTKITGADSSASCAGTVTTSPDESCMQHAESSLWQTTESDAATTVAVCDFVRRRDSDVYGRRSANVRWAVDGAGVKVEDVRPVSGAIMWPTPEHRTSNASINATQRAEKNSPREFSEAH